MRFLPKIWRCAAFVGFLAIFAPADANACTFSDAPEAFDSCSKAIAAQRLRGLELAKIYDTRGSIYYFKKNDADSAIADYSEAIRLAPNFVQAYLDRAFVYHNGKKDSGRAIADYDSVIRLDPKNSEAYAKRGGLHSEEKRYDVAITDYGHAIRLAPKEASYFFSRGAIYYYHKEDYDRAIADYNEAIRLNPEGATYIASRGEGYEKKGDIEKALADYRKALSIRADNRWALEGLARIESKTAVPVAAPADAKPASAATSAAFVSCDDVSGAYQAAADACTLLIASGKAGTEALLSAYVWRGSHFTFLGAHDKAIGDFDRALKLDPNFALAYRGRGASYESSGDLARALADYRKAISIDPGLDDVATSIQRLQDSAAR